MQDSDYDGQGLVICEYYEASFIDEIVAKVKSAPELYTATDVVRMLESI